jgi:methylated-DNA-[protein]-cysteine S-methyltransferase
MDPVEAATLETPIGVLRVTATVAAVTAADWVDEPLPAGAPGPVLRQAVAELVAYFRGERQRFDVALAPAGTPFQRRVWEAVARVPYGRTSSYKEIAAALGKPKAVRAIGAANGQNPLPILIPCHRIVGHDGRLVGYGGGLWRKAWLLRHEGVILV